MQHHENGPSSINRRFLCPASGYMEKGLADIPSKYAETGTAIHNAVWNDIEYDKLAMEDRDIVRKIRDFKDCLVSETSIPISNYNVLHEMLVGLDDRLNDHVFNFGTADFVILGEKKAILADWKTGWNPTPPAYRNFQVANYAAAILQRYDLESVKAYIYSPRTGKISNHTYTDYHGVLNTLRKVVSDSKQNPVQFVPSYEACCYCKARVFCPGPRNVLDDILDDKDFCLIRHHNVESSSGDVVAELIARAKLMKSIGNSIQDYAKQRIKEKNDVPGWKLKFRSGAIKCHDWNSLKERLCPPLKEKDLDMITNDSIKVAKVRDLYCDALKKKGYSIYQGREIFVELADKDIELGELTEVLAENTDEEI